jgi:hypothetical protein
VRRYVQSIEGRRPPKWASQEVIQEETQRRLVVAQQLAADPRMRKVCRALERRRPFDESAICEFIEGACGNPDILYELSVKDQAKSIGYASNVADTCRTLSKVKRMRNDLRLSAAFALVAKHFEKEAREWERMHPVVKKRGKNDQARAYVRRLGRLTQHLFGATLYRTVATTATVALGRGIGWQQMRHWCKTTSGKPRRQK